jgi:hypothetical protein
MNATGTHDGFAREIEFGRDGLLMGSNDGGAPGGMGLARSGDGGKTWTPESDFDPLGQAPCTGECPVRPAGAIVSNGVLFVASSDSAEVEISYDGESWSSVAWDGPTAPAFGIGNGTGVVLLPRGMLMAGGCAAAHQ